MNTTIAAPTAAPSIELETADFQIIKNSQGWYRWLGRGRFAAYASSGLFATPAAVADDAISFLDAAEAQSLDPSGPGCIALETTALYFSE